MEKCTLEMPPTNDKNTSGKGWNARDTRTFASVVARNDEQFDHDNYSDEDSNGISDTMMQEDSSDEVEEGEIIADDIDKVEDSFLRDNTGAGDGQSEQETERVNDDSDPVINDVHGKNDNYHGEPHQPLAELSLGGNFDSDKVNDNNIDNLNKSDNISFGELKNLVPNGCFGAFIQNGAVSSPVGPNGVIIMGQMSANNEASMGCMDAMGPELNFTGSFSKRRKIRANEQCIRSIPPPPTFNVDKPMLPEPELNLNNSPANSATATPHLNPDVDATPEIVRTVRIGRVIGFDIDVDNDILIDAMGETGVQNVTR
ncbi:hypothetical protein L2E82_05142 [Cichorium intybus]|uniref:Uncharacterized protein n=1 Tax=Cichorium intybus TaxID=13427 RepID=A0ACB9H6Q0_CICIN|nr:hypothetical protein L2E82_05142 [Cichorium intybus]